MKTLYITKDPTEYLTPGKDAAAFRVVLKREARIRAEAFQYDEIKIVDHYGHLIEQVSTCADIRDKRYIVGYHVTVRPTTPGLVYDHPQNLEWAEVHGTVIATTNERLVIHAPHPRELETLKCDFHFAIENIEVVRAKS